MSGRLRDRAMLALVELTRPTPHVARARKLLSEGLGDPMDVPCQFCGALIGKACRNVQGDAYDGAHLSRVIATEGRVLDEAARLAAGGASYG